MDRLRATMTYVYAVVYGSEEQLKAVRRAVNRAHAPVRRGPDGASGVQRLRRRVPAVGGRHPLRHCRHRLRAGPWKARRRRRRPHLPRVRADRDCPAASRQHVAAGSGSVHRILECPGARLPAGCAGAGGCARTCSIRPADRGSCGWQCRWLASSRQACCRTMSAKASVSNGARGHARRFQQDHESAGAWSTPGCRNGSGTGPGTTTWANSTWETHMRSVTRTSVEQSIDARSPTATSTVPRGPAAGRGSPNLWCLG